MNIEELKDTKIKFIDVNTVYGDEEETVQELLCNYKGTYDDIKNDVDELKGVVNGIHEEIVDEVNKVAEKQAIGINSNLQIINDNLNNRVNGIENKLDNKINKLEENIDIELRDYKNTVDKTFDNYKKAVDLEVDTCQDNIEKYKNDVMFECETLKIDVDNTKEEIDKQLNEATTDFNGVKHSTLDERLLADLDLVLQKVQEVNLVEYEGTNITAYNTLDGLQKDTVIKGRTLQNIWQNEIILEPQLGENDNVTMTDKGNYWELVYTALDNSPKVDWDMGNAIKFKSLLKVNTDYTIIIPCPVTPDTRNYMIYSSIDKTFKSEENNISKIKFKFTDTTSMVLWLYMYPKTDKVGQQVTLNFPKTLLVLEGDHTQTPLEELPYIDGIESVGESELTDDGYKISGKAIGKNLFDETELLRSTYSSGKIRAISATPSKEIIIDNYTRAYCCIVKVKPNTTYNIKRYDFVENTSLCFGMFKNYEDIYLTEKAENASNVLTSVSEYLLTTNANTNYLLVGVLGLYDYVSVNNTITMNTPIIQLEENTSPTQYEPYKESTYSYILNEPLRSLPNGVCDTIDLATGVLTRRVGKVVLDGSENWKLWHENTSVVCFNISISNKNSSKNILCDNFILAKTYKDDIEGITTSGNVTTLGISINRNKITSPDVDGFKQWLQANPTTVYYELAEPTTEQVKTQLLKSYEGTTHVISDNKLAPVVKTKIPSDIGGMVNTLSLRNRELQTEVNDLNNITDMIIIDSLEGDL